MNKKKVKAMIVAAALATCLLIGGISAYFTDADTATNTFTVGKVSIDLEEPNWEEPENIVPGEEMDKDPQIENDGLNGAYVFMEVIMPYANITTANADGTKNDAADTELFTLLHKLDDGSYEAGVNAGWVLVGDAVKDTDAKTVTYLYAYGTADAMTELAKDATTPTLFDKVKFVNAIEDEGLEGSVQNIVINAYAIQSTNIGEDCVKPADVWTVLNNQAPTTDVTVEEDKTDNKLQ